jgi:SAM-dependent methyltransferase
MLLRFFIGKTIYKTPLSDFLSMNPFPCPLTFGFFYREKMRSIHTIAPDQPLQNILELGGGRSGLTALLYPLAKVINLDINIEYAQAPCNKQANVHFVCGNATEIPFKNHTFDAVTAFDLLEHIPNHKKVVAEVRRVLKPDGFFLVSSPNESWRFPYYKFMKIICPNEDEMFRKWGHVRRGYSLDQLEDLICMSCLNYATFINPCTVLCHDISFSRLPYLLRQSICLILSPLTWSGYILHRPGTKGTETTSLWQKER